MAVVCRPPRAADAEALARLAGQLGYVVTAADLTEWLHRLDGRTDQRAIVAEADGAVVGWTSCRLSELLHGVASIQLGANVVRSDAHHFYAALGFLEVKRQVRFKVPIDPPV